MCRYHLIYVWIFYIHTDIESYMIKYKYVFIFDYTTIFPHKDACACLFVFYININALSTHTFIVVCIHENTEQFLPSRIFSNKKNKILTCHFL